MSSKMPISLVDYLAFRSECTYISDLPRIGTHGKLKIVRALEAVEVGVFPLREWNDALDYLAHERPCKTEEEARKKLISSLLGDCGMED